MRGASIRLFPALVATAVCAATGGCAVGPDFARPPAPETTRYTTSSPSTISAGSADPAQIVDLGSSVASDWWTLFSSRPLSDLVEQALAESPNIEAASARLAAAEQQIRAAQGAFWPQVDLSVAARRQQANGSRTAGVGQVGRSSPAFNLFSFGPSVSYSPDVFGLTRRRVEQQRALAELERYQLGAAYLTLTGNTVSQAITIASARAELDAATDIIARGQEVVDLVQRKYVAGKVARADVLAAESRLAADRTQLPPIRQQLSVARDALAVLVGRLPGDWQPPDFDLAALRLPGDLPLGVPSELVHQRPDILAAEAQLHSDIAAVGIATAQMYPSITLTASSGFEAQEVKDLFDISSLVWDIGTGISAPLFHGGTLNAERKAAIETARATAATYRQTVLQAFGQVADTLRALEHDAELVDAERRALDAANASMSLQRLTYDAGKTELVLLLEAERDYQQARLGLARAQGQRFADTAALLVAVGGGWWKRPQ